MVYMYKNTHMIKKVYIKDQFSHFFIFQNYIVDDFHSYL